MNKYSEELKRLLKKSENEAYILGSNLVTSIHFLLAILSSNNEIKTILNKYNITYKKIKNDIIKQNKNINILSFGLTFKQTIEYTSNYLKENDIEELSSLHLFLNLISNKKDEIYILLKKHTQNFDLMYKDLNKLKFNNKNLLIYEIGTNLNEIVNTNSFNKVYKREKEINEIIEVLARKNKNNPLLIGEAGVGKTAIVEELARKIINKNVPEFLYNKTIVSLNISSVIAGTKYRGEFEDKLNKIIKELDNQENIIIFIDEMHTLIGAGGAEGAIDASNILKPVLARNNIKVIGATTIKEYKKYIEKDKAFDRRFQKILIEEPSTKDVINILEKIKIDYEKFHNVKINNDIIKDIAFLSKKYIFDKKEPDRSIDILDEVCAFVKINDKNNLKHNISNKIKKLIIQKNNFLKNKNYEEAIKIKKQISTYQNKLKNININKNVTKDDLKYIIENKTNQKIYTNEEIKKLINSLKNIIIDQNHIVDNLIDMNISSSQTAILYGPLGCGKTYLINEYSKLLKRNLIKLDMSEYSTEMSINKILGSSKGYIGYDDENNTFESLKFYPNSVILFDEIDKAHPSIINLISTILSEKKIKTNKNEEINFNESIIFITSSIKQKENIGFNKAIKNEEINKLLEDKVNYILKFNQLDENSIKKIIKNKLKKLNQKLNNEEINNIIKESNYKNQGALNIDNIIKKHLEYKLLKI